MPAAPHPAAQPEDAADRRAARMLVALYPPAWRARYREEMLALLADSTLTLSAVAGLLRAAAAAWLRPAAHLHDPDARRRAGLGTILCAYTALAAGALLYGQLNEQQGLGPVTPHHALTARSYQAYVIAAHASVALLALTTAPLWLQLAARAARTRNRRDLLLLTAPFSVPTAFLALLVAVSHLVRGPHGGVGPGWFLALTLLGLAAGAATAGAPILALRHAAPTGRALRIALIGATGAGAVMAIAAAASITNAFALQRWADPSSPLRADPSILAAYAGAMLLAVCAAALGAARSLRTAHPARSRTRGTPPPANDAHDDDATASAAQQP